MTPKEFKRQIKMACAAKEWTLEDLAERMGTYGQTVHAFFRGKPRNVYLAVRMCKASGVDVRLAYQVCGLPIPEPRTRSCKQCGEHTTA